MIPRTYPYLLTADKAGAHVGALVTMHGSDSSAYYGAVKDAFCDAAHVPEEKTWVGMWHLYSDNTAEGVQFHDELSGPNGVHVTLFKMPEMDAEQIKRAKATLRNQRDVTGFTVIHIRELITFPMPPRPETTPTN